MAKLYRKYSALKSKLDSLDFDEKVEKYDQHIVLYVDNIFVRPHFCYPHYQYEENILLKKKFK